MCIGTFYLRLTARVNYLRKSGLLLHWFIILTFLGVFLSIVLECQPLSLSVKLHEHINHC